MSNSCSSKEGGPPARTVPPSSTPPPADDSLPKHLREHAHRLRLILPVISVAVMALHRQNAELDEEIATVLDHHASEALALEIEIIEAIAASLACSHRPKEVAA